MERLIEFEKGNTQIVCDNVGCGFEVPTDLVESIPLRAFVDIECPRCGETLLTQNDYNKAIALEKYINFVNKWFSWLTLFAKKNTKTADIKVHIHNGIKTEII